MTLKSSARVVQTTTLPSGSGRMVPEKISVSFESLNEGSMIVGNGATICAKAESLTKRKRTAMLLAHRLGMPRWFGRAAGKSRTQTLCNGHVPAIRQKQKG